MIHPYSRKEVSLPANNNLSVHEAAKEPNIIPAYDSEDERILSDDYNDDTDFENKNFVEGRGRENYNGSENADDDELRKQLKPIQLRAHLYTSGNKMKVFELDLDVERALSNIDLLKYVSKCSPAAIRLGFLCVHSDCLGSVCAVVQCS